MIVIKKNHRGDDLMVGERPILKIRTNNLNLAKHNFSTKLKIKSGKHKIKDFHFERCRKGREMCWRRAGKALLHGTRDDIELFALHKARQNNFHLELLRTWKPEIWSTYFNVNELTDRNCLTDFWFGKNRRDSVHEFVQVAGVTAGKEYQRDNVTATWIFFLELRLPRDGTMCSESLVC